MREIDEPIALVLDPDYGEKVAILAQQMPVWIISSARNDLAVNKAREELGAKKVTTLLTRPNEKPTNLLMRALYAIDEHHGVVSQSIPYVALWVYGTTEQLSQEFVSELGFKSMEFMTDGFKLSKL